MQGLVRNLEPTSGSGIEVILGLDGARIAVVAVVALHERDPRAYMIEGIAVDLDYQDHGLGKEAMNRALDWAQGQAEQAGLTAVVVTARAHPKNHRSNALLKGFGFSCNRPDETSAAWSVELNWS